MKDENNGAIMIEFVEFKLTKCTLHVGSKKDIKKVKGIKSCCQINNQLTNVRSVCLTKPK